MATATGPQHPFWRAGTDDETQPQQADGSLIGRLLASAPAAPAPPAGDIVLEPERSLEADLEVVIPEIVEHGDPVVHFVRLAPRPAPRHLVSLPVDHRKSPRVIRLHEPHLDRNLTEKDRFDHWRRWMVASKRKELA